MPDIYDNPSSKDIIELVENDLADRVLKVRQMDEFRRCSIAEILRMLIEAGLEAKGYGERKIV